MFDVKVIFVVVVFASSFQRMKIYSVMALSPMCVYISSSDITLLLVTRVCAVDVAVRKTDNNECF